MMLRLLIAVLGCAVLGACATTKRAGPSVPESAVQVYNTTQLTPNQYTVVQHIWIDQAKSSFSYPTFDDVQAGVDAMKKEAGSIGATGIINVMCMDASGYKSGSLLCYGDAVKFN